MTHSEISKLYLLACTAYGREFDEGVAGGWAMILGKLDYGECEGALRRHVEQSQYFPTPRDIMVLAGKGRAGAAGWEAAWGALKREVGRVGRLGEPKITDAVGMATIAALGWQSFCDSPVDDEPAWRAHFRDAYAGFAQRAGGQVVLEALPPAKEQRELPPPAVMALGEALRAGRKP